MFMVFTISFIRVESFFYCLTDRRHQLSVAPSFRRYRACCCTYSRTVLEARNVTPTLAMRSRAPNCVRSGLYMSLLSFTFPEDRFQDVPKQTLVAETFRRRPLLLQEVSHRFGLSRRGVCRQRRHQNGDEVSPELILSSVRTRP